MQDQSDQSNTPSESPVETQTPGRSRQLKGSGSRKAQRSLAQTRATESEEEGFFARHGGKVILLIGSGLLVVAALFVKPTKSTVAKSPERVVTISLPPLPPPPPPPPPKFTPPPPPKEEKVVQQPPVESPEKAKAPEKPKAEPPKEALGTGVKGNGQGLAGLGGSGNGGGFGGPHSEGGGSKWGYFAAQVQGKVTDALRNNKRTKTASLKIQVRIWADKTGRVTRAKLDYSTGNSQLDGAIQDEVLTNLQLDQPPPADMPMPIVMHVTARRP